MFVHSRYSNSTVKRFEIRLVLLEGAETCRATGSDMAAVFGACYAILTKILPRWSILTELINGIDLLASETALAEPAKLVLLESPSNPVLDLIDIKAVVILAHKAGSLVMVDNVFALPLYQKPLALGADIVIYPITKHIDGQGRLLGGAVLGKRGFVEDVFLPFYRQTRAAIGVFDAWVILKSLETLPLRVAAQSETAAKISDWLFQHPNIIKISHPGHASHPLHDLVKQQTSGFGSLLAFDVLGGESAAFTLLNNLHLIDI